MGRVPKRNEQRKDAWNMNPASDYSLEPDVPEHHHYELHNIQLEQHITTRKCDRWTWEDKPLQDQHIIARGGPGASYTSNCIVRM
ncbi:hypothetical protein E2C01_075765 [Portunus trituberculatus]|uniref:Uncharacterized protein n=1 Tax=Portunus trituberculatus TaxID=210409 RepID=A0A5B7I9F6_PORTR|nr:hypothetical protein [Portunus trituberculatus]